jgi:hypothetical protein
MRGRSAGAWGWSFAILLLVSAGMVSVPNGSDSMSTIRVFYESNAGLILVAQVVGLCAALTFIPFAIALQRQRRDRDRDPTSSSWITWSGIAVALAAILTAVPVLWLTAIVDEGDTRVIRRLARAGDLSDCVLFLAIAAFAAALVQAAAVAWLRVAATLVMIASIARAAFLSAGSAFLELVAPLSFVLLVLALSTMTLAHPLFGDVQR